MNKRRFDRLVKQAANAQRLGTGEYDQLMAEAGDELDQPIEGETDTEWDRFCKAVDVAVKVPLTPREQKKKDRLEWDRSVDRARLNMLNAIDVYNDAKSHSRP